MCGVVAGVVAGAGGCSRADVYPVTGSPAGEGGGGGARPLSCPMSALPPGDTTRTLQVGSASRSYVLARPADV